ncbi:MAG: TetR/AcrR family transcriptional regulator [Pseudomonadota bacterium]
MTKSASVPRANRRDQIIGIARNRFRETGLAETTLDMIAAEAGIARPNLYRYFKDKAELVSAVLVAEARAINEFRTARLKGVRGFPNRVVRSIRATVEVMAKDSLWAEIVSPSNVPYTAYVASHDEDVLRSNYDYWMPMLKDAQAKGEMDPELDLEEVMKWLLGIEFMFMERREIFASPKEVEHYAKTFVLPALLR